MADSDNRLDAMEDELRLVKGEIKRTLVDLRAVVMQADSPFERIVAAPTAGAQVIREVVVQKEAASPAPQPAAPTPQQPQQAVQPIQPIQPQIGVPSASQGPVGPLPQVWPNGGGDAEAGHDRAESDSRLDNENGNGSRSRPQLEDEFDENGSRLPELKDEIADRNGSRRRRAQEIDDELAGAEGLSSRRSGRGPRASRNGGPNGRNGSAEAESASDRANGRSKGLEHNGTARSRMDANGPLRDRPSRFEDDEWELDDHDEDDVLHGVEDASRGARPGLNVNLISGLVRWVSSVQGLLGDAGMEEMVDLYFKTTKESAGTRDLISRIADTLAYADTSRVDPRSEQGIAEQWMDMLIQLHGVLNWDCVPPDIPGLGLSKPSEE